MTQEEKELLVKDLCARLPYGVKCNVWYGPKSPALYEKDKYTDDVLETINPQKGNCTFHNAIGYDFGFFLVEHVKPYLRPISSMTEEERNELWFLLSQGRTNIELNSNGQLTTKGNVELGFNYPFVCPQSSAHYIDWLNEHHFDYRGLIPMGLALEATEEMYKS